MTIIHHLLLAGCGPERDRAQWINLSLSTCIYLFIVLDPLSSVIKIECTWCVS